SSTIGEELKDETDFGESGEDTSDVEFELLVLLLILVESVELEFLEHFVVDERIFAIRTVITEATNVVEKGVEEVVLEVDAVANSNVPASRGDITFETTVHCNTSSNWSVKLSRRGRNVFSEMSNGNSSNVGISTCKLEDDKYLDPDLRNSNSQWRMIQRKR